MNFQQMKVLNHIFGKTVETMTLTGNGTIILIIALCSINNFLDLVEQNSIIMIDILTINSNTEETETFLIRDKKGSHQGLSLLSLVHQSIWKRKLNKQVLLL